MPCGRQYGGRFREELVGVTADGMDVVDPKGMDLLLWRPYKAIKAD
jgi:hypothetical protein